jgi:hypothetical protein
MLRRPKATVTMSKWLSGNGSFSASHCATGASMPSSSRRSRPTPSMALLMSVSQTCPALPTLREKADDRSAVPPATSSTRSPGRGAAMSMANFFHRRCKPIDMRSFITSYFCATEEKTPATRCAFSFSSTVSKPKWVCVIV